jgi:hypothetical protein
MNPHTWQDVALAFVAGLPGLIAAWSSIRNGQEQKRVKEELKETKGHILRSRTIGRN